MPSAARQEQRSHSAHGAEKMAAALALFHLGSGGEAEICLLGKVRSTDGDIKGPDPSLSPVYGVRHPWMAPQQLKIPPVSADGRWLVDGMELLELLEGPGMDSKTT